MINDMIRFDLETLIDGELIDTYGGDYTYLYVYYSKDGDRYRFYEEQSGAKKTCLEEVFDEDGEYIQMINEIHTR